MANMTKWLQTKMKIENENIRVKANSKYKQVQ